MERKEKILANVLIVTIIFAVTNIICFTNKFCNTELITVLNSVAAIVAIITVTIVNMN